MFSFPKFRLIGVEIKTYKFSLDCDLAALKRKKVNWIGFLVMFIKGFIMAEISNFMCKI